MEGCGESRKRIVNFRFFVSLVLLITLVECNRKIEFDGNKAKAIVSILCSFGPRNPGGEGHRKAEEYLRMKLRENAEKFREQEFVVGDTLRLVNFFASFGLKNKKRILLGAHWDTRAWADRDIDEKKRKTPIIGANDGASGVAILLVLSEILRRKKCEVGVDIVLFDGEDLGNEDNLFGFCLGSKNFANNLGEYRPEYGIILDMIGDKDLEIYIERYSKERANPVVEKIWKEAKRQDVGEFKSVEKYEILDDHIPLLEKGIPAALVIDFDYPYWHTTEDTPDKVSEKSLEKVGRVIEGVVYGEK